MIELLLLAILCVLWPPILWLLIPAIVLAALVAMCSK